MARSGIIRVYTEHTIKRSSLSEVGYHAFLWTFEQAHGRPVTVGVYGVPDADWPLLSGLIRYIGETWPLSAPMPMVKHVMGVAARARWDVGH